MRQLFFTILLCLTLIGCGSDPEPEPTPQEQMQDAIKDMADSISKNNEGGDGNANNPFSGLADALTGSGGAEPVNFRELRSVLPSSLGGVDKVDTNGETISSFGINVSTVEAEYEMGEKTIMLKVVDMGSLKGIGMMGFAWAGVEFDRETDSGFEKTTTLNGNKAYVKYDVDDKSGEYSAISSGRFIASAEGYGVTVEELESALKAIDFKKLESWKNHGVKAESSTE